MSIFINVTPRHEQGYIEIEVLKSCIVEWSDDQQWWHAFSAADADHSDGRLVIRDRMAPVGRPRTYRASGGAMEASSATLWPARH